MAYMDVILSRHKVSSYVQRLIGWQNLNMEANQAQTETIRVESKHWWILLLF